MRKAKLLFLALLTVAGAVGTSVPATEAAGGGGTPGCRWTCNCAGTPVCVCNPGITGFCVSPPNIGCTQGYNC
jgi:hypothetical protein